MGLTITREAENGVLLNYHRIVTVQQVINNQTTIEVGSYVSANERKKEAKAIANGESMNVYIDTTFYNLPYDSEMNIDKAYEWLKTQPGWEDAVDDNECIAIDNK